MAKEQPRRIETTAEVDGYIDYALQYRVKKVSATDDGCVVEHVYGGVPNAILGKEAFHATTKNIRSRITSLEELLARFAEPELMQ